METQGHTLNNYETAHLHSCFGCWLHAKANMHSLCLQMPVCTHRNALCLPCFCMGTRLLHSHKCRFSTLQVCVALPRTVCWFSPQSTFSPHGNCTCYVRPYIMFAFCMVCCHILPSQQTLPHRFCVTLHS